MKWNKMFKLLGPLSKSIRQSNDGYSFVLKQRTIFQFKDISFECISLDLSKDYLILLSESDFEIVCRNDWDALKIYLI